MENNQLILSIITAVLGALNTALVTYLAYKIKRNGEK